MRIKTYSELILLRTFIERYNYLKLTGQVGVGTFGYDRYLNQILYNSKKWRRLRDDIIIRDHGCDLGVEGYDIYGRIYVHHMNPISLEDIEMRNPIIFDPSLLICTSLRTHNAMHYGDDSLLPELPIKRERFDTCPWKGKDE